MESRLLSIGQTAKLLGVSLDTLRRWDRSGKLQAFRPNSHGHRYYRRDDLELFLQDLAVLAQNWAGSQVAVAPPEQFYCSTRAAFQARLEKLQIKLSKQPALQETFSLLIAISGEIGNNAFDHNLGAWPDLAGIFFAYDLSKKVIVIADRGQGILTTLRRVRPELENHRTALVTAFTEILSGRAPEERGNGLKFVRQVVEQSSFRLTFQSGNARLVIEHSRKVLQPEQVSVELHGCLAILKF
jgi:excisionase family DNA binding protein